MVLIGGRSNLAGHALCRGGAIEKRAIAAVTPGAVGCACRERNVELRHLRGHAVARVPTASSQCSRMSDPQNCYEQNCRCREMAANGWREGKILPRPPISCVVRETDGNRDEGAAIWNARRTASAWLWIDSVLLQVVKELPGRNGHTIFAVDIHFLSVTWVGRY